MKDTLLPYSTDITENNIVNIFNSFINKRIDNINNAIDKLKEEFDSILDSDK
jgi:hypothetical protein